MQGRVVVVTGGASGQGAAEAAWLAQAGAKVVIADVAADAGPLLAESLLGQGLDATFRQLDVTSSEDWSALASWLREEHGAVHGLVNNAGVLSSGRVGELTSLAEWDHVMAVNVKGPLMGMTAVAPLMGAGASIVNVGSTTGHTGHYRVAYTASKWALRGVSKCAALEYGPRGIRVNLVVPGMIESPLTAGIASAARQALLDQTPLGRAGTADDVAALVRFLLSDDSAYLCGTEIPVDGGFTSHGGVMSISDAARRGHGARPDHG